MASEYHLFLPQMRMSFDTLVERARAAEAGGFDGIAFMDHLAPPLAEHHDMWEAMTAAAWVLAHTSTLTVGHLVLCDMLRHPALLARQAVSLDHASDGRFELGIGWGSVPIELEVFGVGSTAARTRVERLAETLDIVSALWTGEPVTYSGTHFTLEGAQQRPVPTRQIPIVIGGTGPRTLELVAKHATWWNVPMHQLDLLESRRPAAGAARASVQVMLAYVASEAERVDVEATVERRFGPTGMNRQMLIGDADEIRARFDAWRERGVERFYLWFADFAEPSTLAAFGRDVIGAR